MNPRIKLSVELYHLNEYLTLKALKEADAGSLDTRPLDKANSFAWIFGHITGSRFQIGKQLGLKNEFKWTELYNMRADVKEPDAYPSIDELKEAFGEICAALKGRFEELTDADLDGEPPFKIPGIEESMAGTISFMAFHEAYHVGQLAYVQRLNGGEQLVG
jgi:uncharacterized damage-inducible protein DinB